MSLSIQALQNTSSFAPIMKKTLALLFVLSTLGTYAQDSIVAPTEKRWDMFKYDFVNMFKGVGYSYARPLHWQGQQWAQFGGAVAGTGAVYLVDEETSSFIQRQKESVPKIIREYGELYGSPENN